MADNPRQNVTFPSNGGQAHGYLATPASGSGPGLIVIQEWWGLDDHMADVVDRFAAAGFVALAPDLYGGRVAHDAESAGRMLQELPVEGAVRDLTGALDYLLALDMVSSGKVGAVGFCMGGGYVLEMAAREGDRVGAAVAFYGVGPAVPDNYRGVTAPIQGHYGELDEAYPVAQARVQEQQIRAESQSTVEFFYYPAGHAFANDTDKLGTYDPESTRLAWDRTLEFLHANLG
jgi:carboxymethylenebutenolidase